MSWNRCPVRVYILEGGCRGEAGVGVTVRVGVILIRAILGWDSQPEKSDQPRSGVRLPSTGILAIWQAMGDSEAEAESGTGERSLFNTRSVGIMVQKYVPNTVNPPLPYLRGNVFGSNL